MRLALRYKINSGLLLLFLCLSLASCANLMKTTATSGTRFGMSREKVEKVMLKKGYPILSQDEHTMIVEGMQEQLKARAIKTFIFQDNRLVSVSDKVLDGSMAGSTFTFMDK